MEEPVGRPVKLPSGVEMTVVAAPFSDANELYKAVLESLKGVRYQGKDDFLEFAKQVVAFAFTNPSLEQALWKCLGRCLYGKQKFTPAVFEPVANRQDYIQCVLECAMENLEPFGKGLFAGWSRVEKMTEDILKSK